MKVSIEKPGTPHELVHHGIKCQKWGVRKKESTVSKNYSRSSVPGSEHFSKEQAASMNTVARKMEKAYGIKIDEFVPLTSKENTQGLAYVALRTKGGRAIHVSNDPSFKSNLDMAEKVGWFPPAAGKNIESCLTHEAAHSLFHQSDISGKGVINAVRAPQPIAGVRLGAWQKAEAQARKDGDVVSKRFRPDGAQFQLAKKISKYADASMWIEEHEAEAFTSYHWNPNPPKFVDTFMTDIHKSMGKQVQPFSGRKVSYAS